MPVNQGKTSAETILQRTMAASLRTGFRIRSLLLDPGGLTIADPTGAQ
jgi:hypothetical protein